MGSIGIQYAFYRNLKMAKPGELYGGKNAGGGIMAHQCLMFLLSRKTWLMSFGVIEKQDEKPGYVTLWYDPGSI